MVIDRDIHKVLHAEAPRRAKAGRRKAWQWQAGRHRRRHGSYTGGDGEDMAWEEREREAVGQKEGELQRRGSWGGRRQGQEGRKKGVGRREGEGKLRHGMFRGRGRLVGKEQLFLLPNCLSC